MQAQHTSSPFRLCQSVGVIKPSLVGISAWVSRSCKLSTSSSFESNSRFITFAQSQSAQRAVRSGFDFYLNPRPMASVSYLQTYWKCWILDRLRQDSKLRGVQVTVFISCCLASRPEMSISESMMEMLRFYDWSQMLQVEEETSLLTLALIFLSCSSSRASSTKVRPPLTTPKMVLAMGMSLTSCEMPSAIFLMRQYSQGLLMLRQSELESMTLWKKELRERCRQRRQMNLGDCLLMWASFSSSLCLGRQCCSSWSILIFIVVKELRIYVIQAFILYCYFNSQVIFCYRQCRVYAVGFASYLS